MVRPMASPASLPSPALVPERLPKHVAIIMDGNGRWAKKRGNLRVFGHRKALTAVRDVTEACSEWGISYLTLYTFSTENWQRPKLEVKALMELLVSTIRKETPELHQNNVRLSSIGELDRLPAKAQRELQEAKDMTADNTGLTLTLALSYGSRMDMLQAIKQLAHQVKEGTLQPEDLEEHHIREALSTAQLPDPELLIRTSGEYRISNFLLWEIAYAELYITPTLWPDFRRADLHEALLNYQQRERRFGRTSEQMEPQGK